MWFMKVNNIYLKTNVNKFNHSIKQHFSVIFVNKGLKHKELKRIVGIRKHPYIKCADKKINKIN